MSDMDADWGRMLETEAHDSGDDVSALNAPDLTALLLTRQERSVIAACITVMMSAPTTTVNEGRALMELWLRVHPDPVDVT